MKHVEILVAIGVIIGFGLGYIYADNERIERESGVQVVSK